MGNLWCGDHHGDSIGNHPFHMNMEFEHHRFGCQSQVEESRTTTEGRTCRTVAWKVVEHWWETCQIPGQRSEPASQDSVVRVAPNQKHEPPVRWVASFRPCRKLIAKGESWQKEDPILDELHPLPSPHNQLHRLKLVRRLVWGKPCPLEPWLGMVPWELAGRPSRWWLDQPCKARIPRHKKENRKHNFEIETTNSSYLYLIFHDNLGKFSPPSGQLWSPNMWRRIWIFIRHSHDQILRLFQLFLQNK